MYSNLNGLRHESFIALSNDTELFAETVNKLIFRGNNISGNLRDSFHNFRDFGCMDAYWDWATNTKLKNPFLFGFHLQPKWVENLVDEFNREFKNFNIEIAWKRELNVVRRRDWDGNINYLFTDETVEKEDFCLEAGSYIYKLNEHIEFQPKTRRKILYIFHHFLRSCSMAERIFRVTDISPHDNYIDHVLNLNNQSGGGRALTDFFVSKEEFLALDDENILESFDTLVHSEMLKQSDILFVIGKLKKYGEKYFRDIPWETGCYPKHPRTFYGIFISAGGYVYIKKKPLGSVVVDQSYTHCNDRTFISARINIDFKHSRLKYLNARRSYYNSSEGGIRNHQMFPLVEIFSRYPELDYEIVPKIVKMVNKGSETNFKVPPKESFIME